MDCYSHACTELKLLRQRQCCWFYYYAKCEILPCRGGPFFTTLTLTCSLLMGKYGHAMLRQTCMNLLKGIIIGAINCLQFNKWHTDGLMKRGVWQLIAIFGKVKSFGFMVNGYFL